MTIDAQDLFQPGSLPAVPTPGLHISEPPWTEAERKANALIDDALKESTAHLDIAVGWARSLGEVELARTLESLAGKVRAAQRTPRRAAR